MKDSNLYLGLDVHGREIMAAVVDAGGAGRYLGVISNRPESVRKLVSKLGAKERIRAVYEAGPTGYGLYWQLEGMGVSCAVAAPTLIREKSPDSRIPRRNSRDAARPPLKSRVLLTQHPEEIEASFREDEEVEAKLKRLNATR